MIRIWPAMVLVALLTSSEASVFAQVTVKAPRDQAPPKLFATGAPALSADGKTLAYIGSFDGRVEIKLWDITTGEQKGVLEPPFSDVYRNMLAMSPDGKVLAAATTHEIQGRVDPRIVLWDLTTRKQTGILRVNRAPWRLAFSPDGQTLASSAAEPYVRLWEVKTGKERANLWTGGGGESPMPFLTFSPNGKRLFPATYGYWNLDTESRLTPLQLPPLHRDARDNYLAISPDSKQYAFNGPYDDKSKTRSVYLFNAETTKVKETLKSSGPVLAFSHNGKVLAVGKKDGIELLVIETGKIIPVEGASDPVYPSRNLTFTPDGKTLIALVPVVPEKKGESERYVVKVWELVWEKDAGK